MHELPPDGPHRWLHRGSPHLLGHVVCVNKQVLIDLIADIVIGEQARDDRLLVGCHQVRQDPPYLTFQVHYAIEVTPPYHQVVQ